MVFFRSSRASGLSDIGSSGGPRRRGSRWLFWFKTALLLAVLGAAAVVISSFRADTRGVKTERYEKLTPDTDSKPAPPGFSRPPGFSQK